MPKRLTLEEHLAALNAIKHKPLDAEIDAMLRKALTYKTSLVCAKAAEIIGEAQHPDFETDLIAVFNRFMHNPTQTDKGCKAKTTSADALYQLSSHHEEVFLAGIRHIQLEPVFGGREDTATDLRSVCALGLVRMNYPDVLNELATLLADPESPARTGAARALAYRGGTDGLPLLRLRILTHENDPQVLSACFGAMLELSHQATLPFVGGFLEHDDTERAEAAAMALGQSRLPDAFDLLKVWHTRTLDPQQRQTALLAIAMLRHDPALGFLIDCVRNEPKTVAQHAISALGIYHFDPNLTEQVQQAAEGRGLDPLIKDIFG